MKNKERGENYVYVHAYMNVADLNTHKTKRTLRGL